MQQAPYPHLLPALCCPHSRPSPHFPIQLLSLPHVSVSEDRVAPAEAPAVGLALALPSPLDSLLLSPGIRGNCPGPGMGGSVPQELGELVEPAAGPGRPEALVLCPLQQGSPPRRPGACLAGAECPGAARGRGTVLGARTTGEGDTGGSEAGGGGAEGLRVGGPEGSRGLAARPGGAGRLLPTWGPGPGGSPPTSSPRVPDDTHYRARGGPEPPDQRSTDACKPLGVSNGNAWGPPQARGSRTGQTPFESVQMFLTRQTHTCSLPNYLQWPILL